MNNRIGFGLRLGSYLLDFMFIMIIINLFEYSGIGEFLSNDNFSFGEEKLIEIDGISINSNSTGRVLFFVFYGLMELFFSASPAKLLLGLIIGTEAGNKAGIKPLTQRYFVKNFPYFLSLFSDHLSKTTFMILIIIFSSLFVFGCLMALQNQRQALHDIISKTAVYRKKIF